MRDSQSDDASMTHPKRVFAKFANVAVDATLGSALFGVLATISPATGALVVTLPAAAVSGLYLFGVGFFLCSNIG